MYYSLLHDRSVPFSSSSGGKDESSCLGSCCPAMDLVALSNMNQLVVQRSIKWEKLFGSACNVTCMTWRPDGKALVIGQDDGLIVLFDVENGQEFSLPKSARPHSQAIVCMSWAKEAPVKSLKPYSPWENSHFAFGRENYDVNISYKDRSTMLLGVRQGEKAGQDRGSDSFKSYASALMDMPLFGVENTPRKDLEILISGDVAGVVTMVAFGFFPIGCIDLSGAFVEDGLSSNPQVRQLRLSDCFKSLFAVLENDGHYRRVLIDTTILAERSNEVRHVAAQFGHISELIEHITNATQEMSKLWSDGMGTLRKLVDPLQHQLRCFDRPNSPEQELFMMLTCGVTSTALQTYIEGLHGPNLQRMAKTLDTMCAKMEQVAVEVLTHAAQSLVFRLQDMLGLAKWVEKFGPIGLSQELIENLIEVSQILLLKVNEITTWVRDARANFAALMVWLLMVWKKTQKSSGEDQTSNNFGQPDTDRLVRLLSRQLMHLHITEQFENERLTHCEPAQQQFWKSLAETGKSGNICDTSLQQALVQLKSHWNTAFHKASEVISKSFHPISNEKIALVTNNRLQDITTCLDGFKMLIGLANSNKVSLVMTPLTGKGSYTETFTLGNVTEIFDVKFIDDERVLITFTNEQNRLHLGEIALDDEEFPNEVSKCRELMTQQATNLICQGKRGIAIVFTSNRRLQVFDIEEDEEEEEEEDGDEE